jgi:DNA polymerase I-like protein with 3'-5' exonuclease and polymerase domains
MKPVTKDAYKLFHDGMLTFSKIEQNGIRIDQDYLEKSITRITAEIKDKEQALRNSKVYRVWQQAYGRKTKLGSKEQLFNVIFRKMGYEYKGGVTAKGKYKTDENAFRDLDEPFVKDYFKIEKLKKAKGTYLEGIRREVTNGFLHPFFNLHTALTYRSSSSDPNFQNIPIRNPETAELIRRCFIPRKNHILLELDFKGMEVCVAACYCKDPNLISYVSDHTKDMHRDEAMRLFKLKDYQVSHQLRNWIKNQFVFPEFYGSFYVDCARFIWENLQRYNVRICKKGDPVKAPTGPLVINEWLAKHLKVKDLGELNYEEKPRAGTFEKLVADEEHYFWTKRFPGYAQWKKDWYAAYLASGAFDTFTGFHIEGFYRRNQINNIPIQGSAFHILLWALNRLQEWLTKNKMVSKIIGQIHDSAELDVHKSEWDAVLNKAIYYATIAVRKYWDWIVVPLTVEAEASDKNWFEKKAVKLAA